jgi:hypothetical protein
MSLFKEGYFSFPSFDCWPALKKEKAPRIAYNKALIFNIKPLQKNVCTLICSRVMPFFLRPYFGEHLSKISKKRDFSPILAVFVLKNGRLTRFHIDILTYHYWYQYYITGKHTKKSKLKILSAEPYLCFSQQII